VYLQVEVGRPFADEVDMRRQKRTRPARLSGGQTQYSQNPASRSSRSAASLCRKRLFLVIVLGVVATVSPLS
jgi:hypothetical protein